MKLFCPREKCYYYGHNSRKYPRKCYYQLQCFRGWLDELLGLIGSAIDFRLRAKGKITELKLKKG